MFNNEDEEIDNEVDSIINQLKNQGKVFKRVEKEKKTIKKEDMEDFIIDNASSVVNDAVDMIQQLKDSVIASDDPKMIESMAELVKSVTGAIDSLSKLKIADDKNRNQKDLKKMDIDSKQNLTTQENTTKLLLSREELIKEMLKAKSSDSGKITTSEDTIIDID